MSSNIPNRPLEASFARSTSRTRSGSPSEWRIPERAYGMRYALRMRLRLRLVHCTLALTPGISGATPKIGGNETNAGAGLFFIRSIAKVSGNYFVLYSGNSLYKLVRKQPTPNLLYGDPFKEGHRIVTDLPHWQGTAVGIDISVDDTAEFSTLLEIIRKSYKIGVGNQKKAYFKKIQFT